MAGNQVTLTFAGDSEKLERAFSKVGESSRSMGRSVQETESRFNRLGESTDRMATKSSTAYGAFGALQSGIDLTRIKAQKHAEALKDQADQLQKVADAAKDHINDLKAQAQADGKVTDAEKAQIEQAQKAADAAQKAADAKKDEADAADKAANKQTGLTTGLMAAGLAFDALSGVTDLATLGLEANTFKKVGNTAATVASTAASGIARGATLAWTGAQWLLNAALTANPIGLIIAGIVALIAIIVLIATKTTWFQTAWKASWGAIKSAAVAVWDWLKQLPGWIGSAFAKVAGFISAPYRAAFNFIADAWNNTIGRLHWTIPDWIPGLGGKTISVPQLPKFHSGGTVPGAPGSEMLAVLQAGETVTPANQSSGGMEMRVTGGGSFFTFFKNAARNGEIEFYVDGHKVKVV